MSKTQIKLAVRMPLALLLASAVVSSVMPAQAEVSVQAAPMVTEAKAQDLLQAYCVDCHGSEKQKGKVRFDALETIDAVARQELFVKAQESLHFDEMPPAKAKQPTEAERKQLLNWLSSQLTGDEAKKLKEKLTQPAYGNYVDHEALFSGKHADEKAFTYDRRWLISEYIFDVKMNKLMRYNMHLDFDGKRHTVPHFYTGFRMNLTNPFLLPTNSGVRYYANETLNGGHLLTMLTNAKDVAHLMVTQHAKRDRRFIPALSEIMAMEDGHDKTIESRAYFLSRHVEQELVTLFGDKHAAMLPAFTPTKIEVPKPEPGVKKSNFDAAKPANEELDFIFRAVVKYMDQAADDLELIALAEREWFIHGHNPRKVKTRLAFMANYMDGLKSRLKDSRTRDRHKPFVYKPLNDEELAVVGEALRKHRKPGDSYQAVIDKAIAQWQAEFLQERIDAGPPSDELVTQLIEQLFQMICERSPSEAEAQKYVALTRSYIDQLGNLDALQKLIQTLILRTEFVYRSEFGQGEADEHGRRMMSPRDASYAIAYALTDSRPDPELVKAAEDGRLNTREDYRREVTRLLKRRDQYSVIDEKVMLQTRMSVVSTTNMPSREMRFFREFFGYPNMLGIFKDNKRFGKNYDNSKPRLIAEADMLVEHILESDQDVIKKLLTTDQFYVFHTGNNEKMAEGSKQVAELYAYFKDLDWQNFTNEDLARHKPFLDKMKIRADQNSVKKAAGDAAIRFAKGQKSAPPFGVNGIGRRGGQMPSPEVAEFFNIKLDDWNYPTTQPFKVAHRKGMLTHPAWLIAHAQNTETDPIHRGKWIREKLLADTIPDVPITVDAVIPEDPHKTLRQRMAKKTGAEYCWTCHQKMDPLGLPFEMYDDFGRYRTEERLEYPENLVTKVKDKGAIHEDLRDIYKTLPVETTGVLEGTGDRSLDGEVADALDLIDRLAKSDRVRQSIIRHAFRFFLGRNETLADSKTLIDADQAYLKSGGSFDAVIISLLTSDSFIYRKEPKD